MGHTVRKANIGGLNNPDRVKEIASKGGSTGHRARSITVGDKLRPDEWAILLKLINYTAGRIRLEGGEGIDAVEQHNIYHKVFDYWEKEDWVGAMMDICDHPRWQDTFSELLNEMNTYYRGQVLGTPRGSEERDLARIYRNITAAYKVARKEKDGSEKTT